MKISCGFYQVGIGVLCWMLFFAPNSSCAQAVLGAREVAMGQAVSALPGSNWAIFDNTALISSTGKKVSFFGIRYYGLDNLTDMAMSVSYPAKLGVFAGGAHRFGDDLYNESRMRVGYKNNFTGFHYGGAINYYNVQQGGDYGSLGTVGIDVGLAAEITTDLWIGAKATNINQPKFGKYNNIAEEPARDLSIGFSYRVEDLFLFASDIYKDVRFPLSYRAGAEIGIYESFKGRVGITTEPVTFAGGFGYSADFWSVNIVAQQHENPVLGLSPGIDFSLAW